MLKVRRARWRRAWDCRGKKFGQLGENPTDTLWKRDFGVQGRVREAVKNVLADFVR